MIQNECNKTKGFVVPQIPQSHTPQTHANEFKGYANYSILPVRTKGRITMGENGNNIEFYKRQITDIVNRINDTDALNYIHIIVSDIGKEVGVNE